MGRASRPGNRGRSRSLGSVGPRGSRTLFVTVGMTRRRGHGGASASRRRLAGSHGAKRRWVPIGPARSSRPVASRPACPEKPRRRFSGTTSRAFGRPGRHREVSQRARQPGVSVTVTAIVTGKPDSESFSLPPLLQAPRFAEGVCLLLLRVYGLSENLSLTPSLSPIPPFLSPILVFRVSLRVTRMLSPSLSRSEARRLGVSGSPLSDRAFRVCPSVH